MKLTLTDEQVVSIIDALDYYTNMEAGMTQKPELCVPSDYPEHNLARDIERRLSISRKLKADPQTGESIRSGS